MKVIFSGSSSFALPALAAILNSKHQIVAVYTQPDKPAGRGKKLSSTPVKNFALMHQLPLYQPTTLKDVNTQKKLLGLKADILINVAYGLLIPETVLNGFKFGAINIHPSLLPKWRGAAPIQRSILAGDTVTGVTIMKMDPGLDTGDIYQQETLPIVPTDTSETLSQKTSVLGAKMLLKVLASLEQTNLSTTAQTEQLSTYAHKISKAEAKIDWHQTANKIERMIRAFYPWPIAYTKYLDQYIRVWEAKVENNPSWQNAYFPGTIVNISKTGVEIATGDGILTLTKIQFAGGKPLTIQEVLNAQTQIFTIGTKLES